jgi:hypothetical protein
VTVPAITTSAADIAAILDLVGPDLGTPLADTPIWNEMAPRWAKMQAQFAEWEAETRPADQAEQVTEEPAMPPRPRKSSRGGPNRARPGSSTRRAANAPQAPTETRSVGSKPEVHSEEES